MKQKINNKLIKRNPVTHAKHKKEFLIQILLPIAGLILLFAGLWGLFALTDGGTISSWASISVIFLGFFVLLVASVILVGLVYVAIALGKLLNILPEKTYVAQKWLQKMKMKVFELSDKAVSPFISTKSLLSLFRSKRSTNKD